MLIYNLDELINLMIENAIGIDHFELSMIVPNEEFWNEFIYE